VRCCRRAGTELDPGLVARRLATSEVRGVAAPAYLARAGVPITADDLAHHTCLLGFARGERPATHWPLRDGGKVRVRGRLISNDLRLLVDAARRGLGVALFPALVYEAEMAAGELVPVLPDVLGATSVVARVYLDRKLTRAAVRAFVDHVVTGLAEESIYVRI
jgi:DNA-binding transcriptional LysR family regulator